MKTRYFFAALGMALTAACSHAAPKAAPATAPAIRLTLLPQSEIAPGQTTTLLLKLNRIEERRLITDDDLETVHTKKIHLLVIDPTLTDYQHLHPVPTGTPGVYSVAFTPKLAGGYRAWADITIAGKQEFVTTDLGARRPGAIDTGEKHEASVGGYRFTLSFDQPPTAGGETMGTVRIADAAGKPVQTLEPVMGTFGHIVGFYGDYRTVVHTHPMGEEPKSESARGGPELMFHLAPAKPGFVRLFAQVKIGGKEYYAPFGVNIGK